ncbi:Survival factor 1 [Zancudomyces culisetae]|uniref:Survival factor 1 n=1 Tax=Zancudomyces culisetae TaxID=1213189 RepID=A0A1R1PXM5_ZANCU|nr:Survival factor 1 [Zancudomyces culisetae]|eukprot:OMH85648.1 Survival factor 1 [Zancudomyces culisetae]
MNVGEDNLSIDSGIVRMTWCNEFKKIYIDYDNKFEGDSHIEIHLVFDFDSNGYKIGEGVNELSGGKVKHSFIPYGEIVATTKAHDLDLHEARGHGTFIHALSTGILPYNVGVLWDFCVAAGKSETTGETFVFHILQYLTPEKADSKLITQGALIRDGKRGIYFWDNKVEHKNIAKSEVSGYDIPKNILLTMNGETEDGEKASLVLDAHPDEFLSEIDILGNMNRVLRTVVQAIVTKPFLCNWIDNNCVLKLKVGDTEETLKGVSFHEITYMS